MDYLQIFGLNASLYGKSILETNKTSFAKGHLISKCPFVIIVWTTIPTKLFLDFCPEIFEPSWGLPGSFLGLPVGFLVYDITY